VENNLDGNRSQKPGPAVTLVAYTTFAGATEMFRWQEDISIADIRIIISTTLTCKLT
jgi:hypothetical protein